MHYNNSDFKLEFLLYCWGTLSLMHGKRLQGNIMLSNLQSHILNCYETVVHQEWWSMLEGLMLLEHPNILFHFPNTTKKEQKLAPTYKKYRLVYNFQFLCNDIHFHTSTTYRHLWLIRVRFFNVNVAMNEGNMQVVAAHSQHKTQQRLWSSPVTMRRVKVSLRAFLASYFTSRDTGGRSLRDALEYSGIDVGGAHQVNTAALLIHHSKLRASMDRLVCQDSCI